MRSSRRMPIAISAWRTVDRARRAARRCRVRVVDIRDLAAAASGQFAPIRSTARCIPREFHGPCSSSSWGALFARPLPASRRSASRRNSAAAGGGPSPGCARLKRARRQAFDVDHEKVDVVGAGGDRVRSSARSRCAGSLPPGGASRTQRGAAPPTARDSARRRAAASPAWAGPGGKLSSARVRNASAPRTSRAILSGAGEVQPPSALLEERNLERLGELLEL